MQPTAGTLWMASGTVTMTVQWNRFLKMRSLPEGLTSYFIRNGTASLPGQPAALWEVGAAAHYKMRRNWEVTVRTGKMLSQTFSTRRGSCGCSCRDLNTRGWNPIYEDVEWSYWNLRKGIHSQWLLVLWDSTFLVSLMSSQILIKLMQYKPALVLLEREAVIKLAEPS